MATVAELVIKCRDDASKVLQALGKSAKDVGKSLKESFSGLKDFGEDLAKLGAVGVGAFGLAVKGASDFESQLKNTMTMTGLSGGQFDKMEGKVAELANTMALKFGVKGTEVLKSFYYVLSTGTQAGSKDFKILADAALSLSTVIDQDVSTSVTQIADLTKIWGKEMGESAHTADVLFKGSQLGNTTVEQLAEAMNIAGKAASGLGIPMEDCAAALVMFSNVGLKAEKGGSALRALLAKLAAPTAEATAALKALNISVYDGASRMKTMSEMTADMGKWLQKLPTDKQAQAFGFLGITATDAVGKMKPMKDILQELALKFPRGIPAETIAQLQKLGYDASVSTGKLKPLEQILTTLSQKFATLSDEEKANYASALAGEEYYAALMIALQGDTTAINTFSEKMQKNGIIAGALDQKLKTLKKQLERLAVGFQQVVNTIGAQLIPVLTPLAQKLTNISQAVVKYLKDHPKLIQTYTLWAAKAALVVTALGAVLVGIGAFVTQAVGFLSGFAVVVTALFSPLGLLLLGLFTGVAAAWATNFGGIQTTVTGAVATIKTHWDTFIGLIKGGKIEEAMAFLKQTWDEVWNGLKAKTAETVASLNLYWATLKSNATTAFQDIQAKVTSFIVKIQDIKNAVGEMAQKFKDDFANNPLTQFFSSISLPAIDWGPIINGISLVAGALAVAMPLINAVKIAIAIISGPTGLGLIIAAMALLYAAWVNNWGGIQTKVMEVVAVIKQWWNDTMAAIQAKVQEVLPIIQQYWSAFMAWLRPIIDSFIAEIVPKLIVLFDTIKTGVQDIWESVGPLLLSLWETVSKTLADIWTLVEPWLPTIFGMIQLALQTAIGVIGAIILGFIVVLKGYIALVKGAIDNYLVPIIKGIETVFNVTFDAIKLVINGFKVAWDEWTGGFVTSKQQIESIFRDIKNAIKSALDGAAVAINAWTGGTLKALQTQLNNLLKLIDKIRGARTQAAQAQSSDAGGNAGGSSDTGKRITLNSGGTIRGSGDSGYMASGSTGGGNIIINGPVYGGSSGLRELTDLINKYNVQRQLRGV